VLRGNSGNNELYGFDGRDMLVGGGGSDLMYGGEDYDVFDFNALTDSKPGAQRDVIADFKGIGTLHPSFDVIDLRDIDANAGVAGDQAFKWIGSAAFTGAGQLRYSSGILQGSVDADAAPEFEVELSGAPPLVMVDAQHDVLL
jgi:Ca2+-binding RTX toxin-like protein